MGNPAENKFRWILSMTLTVLAVVAIILHIVIAAEEHRITGKRWTTSIADEIAGVSITGYLLALLVALLTISFEIGWVNYSSYWRAVWRFLALVVFMFVSIAAGMNANSSATSNTVSAALVFDLLFLLVLSVNMIVGPGEVRTEDKDFFFTSRPGAVYLQVALLFLYLLLAIPAFIVHIVAAAHVKNGTNPSGTGITGLVVSMLVVILALLDIVKGWSKVYDWFVNAWHVLAIIAYFFLSFTVGQWSAALKYLAVASHVLDLLCLLILMAHMFTFRSLHDVQSAALYSDAAAAEHRSDFGSSAARQYGTANAGMP